MELRSGGMVVPVPFRRWIRVRYRNPRPAHGGFYCRVPIRGQTVIAVVARYRHGRQLEYKAYSIFVREYKDVFSLGDNLIWTENDFRTPFYAGSFMGASNGPLQAASYYFPWVLVPYGWPHVD
ncbi:hypothetical protein RHMOL_Rhmol05G0136900 [Rhododendron molle]|uniref:Uncharacterized protein n=1 Tax=Rhododendron molle TaxID=49168 RepID=A0ACC0NQ88_RHOML|nr:hypothetical protein RHMOL_Rhmol05G0136900 [Rhododendron molle]